jgi:hypothetical protein
MFDADSFMNSVVSDANETRIVPCPVGEYPATITAIEPKTGSTEKGQWASLNVTVAIEGDPTVKQITGLDKKLVRGSVFLDLNDAGTGLATGPGKNVQLGRLREAAGLNVPGQPFQPSMLLGRSIRVRVTNRPDSKGATNPDGSTVMYDDIGGWLKAA